MKAREPSTATTEFFAAVAEPAMFAEMFDVLPEVYLFIKDAQHRYVKVNRSECALHGCADEGEMIGKTDFDYHPPALAAQYVEEDRRVMAAGRPLVDQVWLVRGADGTPRWYLSSKFPVRGRGGVVIGVAGVMRPYERAGAAPGDYQRLTRACEFVLAHYGEPIAVDDIAKCAHLSASQLQREFRRLFGMSLGDYVLRVRLIMARRRLETTAVAVGQIALDCGFYDQSHFTRAFRGEMGLTPREYRQRFTPTRG
ncbi:MAG: AraC family transcriptional regulator [Opitutaceae bacterium]|nr:AraC family transcriptional regulator [Opitutaceae bacterium]